MRTDEHGSNSAPPTVSVSMFDVEVNHLSTRCAMLPNHMRIKGLGAAAG